MLLGTVVQVALDASPLGVPGSDDAGTRGLQLIGLMAHLVEGGREAWRAESRRTLRRASSSRCSSMSRRWRKSVRTPRSIMYPASMPIVTEAMKKKLLLTRISVGVLFTQIATTS